MRPRQALVPVISSFQSSNSLKLNGRDWSDLLIGGANDPSVGKIRSDKVDSTDLAARLAAVDKRIADSEEFAKKLQTVITEAAGKIEAQKQKSHSYADKWIKI